MRNALGDSGAGGRRKRGTTCRSHTVQVVLTESRTTPLKATYPRIAYAAFTASEGVIKAFL